MQAAAQKTLEAVSFDLLRTDLPVGVFVLHTREPAVLPTQHKHQPSLQTHPYCSTDFSADTKHSGSLSFMIKLPVQNLFLRLNGLK